LNNLAKRVHSPKKKHPKVLFSQLKTDSYLLTAAFNAAPAFKATAFDAEI